MRKVGKQLSLQYINAYMTANKWKGFDELTFDLNNELERRGSDFRYTKDNIKDFWNRAGLGFKYVPRTMIEFSTFTKRDQHTLLGFSWFTEKTMYIPKQDVVVFMDPFSVRVVPAGVPSDLGSIPKWARIVADKDDPRFIHGFLVHDVDFVIKWTTFTATNLRLSRTARRMGASLWRRVGVLFGIMTGGYSAWKSVEKRYSKQEIADIKRKTINATADYLNKNIGTLKKLAGKYNYK